MKTFMKNLLLKIKRCSVLFLLVSFAFLFAGCSSKPSTGDGKQAIQSQIEKDAQGRINLLEFHKTNGQLVEINAVKIYSMEFEAEIEFTEDCKWVTDIMTRHFSFRTSKLVGQSNSGFNMGKFIDDADNPGSPVQKGQKVKIAGVIRFEKKENGWSVDGIEINQATLVGGSTSEVSQQTPKPSTVAVDASHTSPTASPAHTSTSQQTNQTPDSEELMVTKVLKQIDDSKNQWAMENAKTTGDIPTETDLKRFFPNNEFPIHPSGGSYIINAIGQPPESSKYGKLNYLQVKFHDQLYPKPHRDFANMTMDQLQRLVARDMREIDTAKIQWALKGIYSKDWPTPTEDDLKPYLYGGYFPEHPPGGHYIINPEGQAPESSTYGKSP
jgi:hypothetical protein